MSEPITSALSGQLSALGIDSEALTLAGSAVEQTVDQMIHRATVRVGLAKAGRDSSYSEGLAIILTTMWGGTRSAALDTANMPPAPLREDVATVAMLMALAPTLPHNDSIAQSDPGWRIDTPTAAELPMRELREEVDAEEDDDSERDCSCINCEDRHCEGDCDRCSDSECPQCHGNLSRCCGYCEQCEHCHDESGYDRNTRDLSCERGHRLRYCTECDHQCESCGC